MKFGLLFVFALFQGLGADFVGFHRRVSGRMAWARCAWPLFDLRTEKLDAPPPVLGDCASRTWSTASS